MGFSTSWFAVQGVSREEVLTTLGVEPSGQKRGVPAFRLAMAELPGGWLLVWHERDLEKAFRNAAALSRHGPAVACAIEEHVMVSEARGYGGGGEIWRIRHDPDASVYHLETTGAPPAQLTQIRADAKAAQKSEGGEDADVDLIFDVPAELAKSICGFKHDEDPPAGVVFEELSRIKGSTGSAKPGFLARLFGAR